MAYAEDDGVCLEQEIGDAVNKLYKKCCEGVSYCNGRGDTHAGIERYG